MPFESSQTLQVTIPASTLKNGTYYEFRIGFPFSDHTFYSNSLVAKTFDSNSAFVNSIVATSTNESISVSWGTPEYSDGIVGYRVSVLYQRVGNAQVAVPQSWNVSTLNVFAGTPYQVPLMQTSVVISCTNTNNSETCLESNTVYVIGVSVIRQSVTGAPKYVFVATEQTVIPVVPTNLFFFYGSLITLNIASTAAVYTAAPISSTVISPAIITSQAGDVTLQLQNSTVTTVSSSVVQIKISYAEYTSLRTQIFATKFTPLTLAYGSGNRGAALTFYCLSLSH